MGPGQPARRTSCRAAGRCRRAATRRARGHASRADHLRDPPAGTAATRDREHPGAPSRPECGGRRGLAGSGWWRGGDARDCSADPYVARVCARGRLQRGCPRTGRCARAAVLPRAVGRRLPHRDGEPVRHRIVHGSRTGHVLAPDAGAARRRGRARATRTGPDRRRLRQRREQRPRLLAAPSSTPTSPSTCTATPPANGSASTPAPPSLPTASGWPSPPCTTSKARSDAPSRACTSPPAADFRLFTMQGA